MGIFSQMQLNFHALMKYLMKYHSLFVIFEKEAKFEIVVCYKL